VVKLVCINQWSHGDRKSFPTDSCSFGNSTWSGQVLCPGDGSHTLHSIFAGNQVTQEHDQRIMGNRSSVSEQPKEGIGEGMSTSVADSSAQEFIRGNVSQEDGSLLPIIVETPHSKIEVGAEEREDATYILFLLYISGL